MTFRQRLAEAEAALEAVKAEGEAIVSQVKQGDFESLRRALRELGVDDSDIDELAEVLHVRTDKVERAEDI